MFEVAWVSRCKRQIQRLLGRRAREAAMDPVDEVLLQLRDYCESHSDPASLEDRVIRQVLDAATEQVRDVPAKRRHGETATVSKASALARAH